jgi:hypothetical protein
MAGWQTIVRLRRLEEQVGALGMRIGSPRGGRWDGETDIISLYPKDDALPIFSRDADLFRGSIEEAEVWVRGVAWARQYDLLMIGNSIDTKRARKEQDYRNRELLKMIKAKDDKNVQ